MSSIKQEFSEVHFTNTILSSFLILIVLILIGCNYQKELNETEKLEFLAKSWGLLKYYHPEVGSGELNWDSVLVEYIDPVMLSETNEEFNFQLQKMIEEPGLFPSSSQECLEDSTEQMVNFDWINSPYLTDVNKKLLNSLLKSKRTQRNKFVSDSVGNRSLDYARFYEDPLKEADLNRTEVRLLSLFRYWNIIEYFFPYKDLTDKKWDQVLTEYIPQFINASDNESFYKELLKLSAEINDGHSNIPYHPEFRLAFLGRYTVPFTVKFAGDQLVVSEFKSDRLSKESNIKIGDIITEIDGQPTNQKASDLGQYLPRPNKAFHYREIAQHILNGNSETLSIQVLRDSSSMGFEIKRFTFTEIERNQSQIVVDPWQILDGNIGYAHMGALIDTDLPEFFSAIENTQGLILDFRHYPNWQVFDDFLNHFYTEKKPFAKLKTQCLSQPGSYYWHYPESVLNSITPIDNSYQNPILILVNEQTFSFGEYFVMALQVLNNVTVIGSQTAGSDGNQVGIDMPGGMIMYVSSLGIYYPNGDNSQRTGIKIDLEVLPTLKGIVTGKDEILEKAIHIAEAR